MEIEVTPSAYRVAMQFKDSCGTNREIAKSIGVGIRTVETQMLQLRKKTGSATRSHLWKWMQSNELIPVHAATARRQRRISRLNNLSISMTEEEMAQHLNISRATIGSYKRELRKCKSL
jgi:DNA-binding CsgD family transcriptional regulator